MSSPESPRTESPHAKPICAIDGCDRPVREGRLTRYCSPEHTRKGKANQGRTYRLRLRDKKLLPRQEPLQQVYEIPSAPLVIRPFAPAPLQYSPDDGEPLPFRDDLNAIHDHGSPGRLIAP